MKCTDPIFIYPSISAIIPNMIMITSIFLIMALLFMATRKSLFVLFQAKKEKKRLRQWAMSPPIKNAVTIIDTLYKNINGMQISLDERKRLDKQNASLLYGEVIFYSFADLLNIAQPKSGEIFYDLGCGVGKPVFIAALLHDFKKACGIELLLPLYQAAENCRQTFDTLPQRHNFYPEKNYHIEFRHEDILTADFLDGDLIFINGTAFIGITWDKIVEKLKQLKPGARVIVTSKALPERHFSLLHQGSHLMSWGLASVFIYERSHPERNTKNLLQKDVIPSVAEGPHDDTAALHCHSNPPHSLTTERSIS